jgi:hypothetical protein
MCNNRNPIKIQLTIKIKSLSLAIGCLVAGPVHISKVSEKLINLRLKYGNSTLIINVTRRSFHIFNN